MRPRKIFQGSICLEGFPGGSDDNLPAMQETQVDETHEGIPGEYLS